MAKIQLNDVSNLLVNPVSAANTLNQNSRLIEAAVDTLLSRDGKNPNQMQADLDMNHHKVLNAARIDTQQLMLDGKPVFATPYTPETTEVTPELFGAVGDGVADDTLPIQQMISAGFNNVNWGNGTFRVTDTLVVPDEGTVWAGSGATIRYDYTVKGYAVPIVIVMETATRSRFNGIVFDHQGFDAPEPSITQEIDYLLTDAVVCMADDTTFLSCDFLNGWGNGLGFSRFNYTGDGSAGNPFVVEDDPFPGFAPFRCSAIGCYFYRCGSGAHVTAPYSGERGGGGLNFLMSNNCVADSCFAYECTTGFIIDFGAGAIQNILSNCVSISSGLAWPSNNYDANGWGFWIGDGENILQSCLAGNNLKQGFVLSEFSDRTILQSCMSVKNFRSGLWLASDKVVATGCMITENSLEDLYTSSGAFYPGILVNPHAKDIEVTFVNCTSVSQYQTYGLQSTGAFDAKISWTLGDLEGTDGNVSIHADSVLRLAGDDTDGDYGLNTHATGGPTQVSLGTFESALKLGSNYVWVDDDDVLRFKAGSAPTTDTDGTAILGAGGASVLNDLTDVDAASPSDGDLLGWNDTDGEWQPMPPIDTSDFVQGPVSSTDNSLATFDGTGGDTVQDAGATLVSGVLSGITEVTSGATARTAIKGQGGNTAASAGYVGEYLTETFDTPVALTTGVPATVVELSGLTAGDWDVWGVLHFTGQAATTVSTVSGGVSETLDTLPSAEFRTIMPFNDATVFQFSNIQVPVPCQVIQLSGTTDIQLVAQAAFDAGTLSATGSIYARRRS